MKSILIVSEQFTIGGLETHIHDEIRHLTELGYATHLATGTVYREELLPECLTSFTPGLALTHSATPTELLSVVDALRKLIRDKQVGFVHIHPFSSIVPA